MPSRTSSLSHSNQKRLSTSNQNVQDPKQKPLAPKKAKEINEESSVPKKLPDVGHYLNDLNHIKQDKHQFHVFVGSLYEPKEQLIHNEDERITSVSSPAIHRNKSIIYLNPNSPIQLSRATSVMSQTSNNSFMTLRNSLPFSRVFDSDFLTPETALSKLSPSSNFVGYHHATWYVSNAKQSASYFINCFGFKWIAYKGLETGSKLIASHVIQNGDVIFEFISPIIPHSKRPKDDAYLKSIFKFIQRHGDGVKDVSFEVKDVDCVFKASIKSGAKAIIKPKLLKDRFGIVKVATIEVFEDLHHTLVEKKDYRGTFLPGYTNVEHNRQYELVDAHCLNHLPPVKVNKIDHCVQNENWNKLEDACDVYSRVFGFHKFWSVDEEDVSTEFSALRSIVMASENEEVKMPLNEPAKGLCKSQIEEFLDFYDGPGVQHIALLTDNIVEAVNNMKLRGAQFISVPRSYYQNLLPKLLETGIKINEDLSELERLGILVDFDRKGYLLQIFTKPLTDRPTFFLEIIQRHNHDGFGKGNFKALFETIEQEQRLRGTLK